MHEVLVNRLGGLSLPRKSVVRLTDRPDMTLDVYHGSKTTIQQFWLSDGSSVRHFLVRIHNNNSLWKSLIKWTPEQSITVAVYIHGWKHFKEVSSL